MHALSPHAHAGAALKKNVYLPSTGDCRSIDNGVSEASIAFCDAKIDTSTFSLQIEASISHTLWLLAKACKILPIDYCCALVVLPNPSHLPFFSFLLFRSMFIIFCTSSFPLKMHTLVSHNRNRKTGFYSPLSKLDLSILHAWSDKKPGSFWFKT